MEIAYDEKTEEGDTCYYDALRYVRLTDLGKYVFGITKKYEHQAAQKKKYFELDDSNLIVKSLDANNPFLSILTDIVMEIPTNNKDLLRIILSDPIISKYSVKAEGYLLLVEVSNRIKVAAALKKYGYLL